MEQAWIIPALGFIAFGVLTLFRGVLPAQGKYLSIAAILGGFVMFWVVLADFLSEGVGQYLLPRSWFDAGPLSVGSGMIIDPLTIVMLGLITFVSLVVQIYSLEYMRHGGKDDPRIGWYYASHSLFSASMLALVLADNLLLLYVAWELVGLCSYLLIGFWYERQSAAEAAKKAFITTRLGDVGLLIGILLLFREFGTFDISLILANLDNPDVNGTALTASAFLLFLGAMGKSAQFPFHVWLPDAMEGPTPVSALIHAATMVTAGVFLVARMLPLFEAVPSAQIFVASIGIITGLMGATMALAATDLKRILAFSTMSHLGFMMLALGAGGYTAAIFHLLMHGLAKAMLFLCAGSIMHAMHDQTDIRKMGGLRRRMPVTGNAFIVGALALAGLPPLAAFWSKDEMLLAVAEGLPPIFVALFLVAIVLSALYMARAIRLVFFGTIGRDNQRVRENPVAMTGVLQVLTFLSVFAGLIALPIGNTYQGVGYFIRQFGVPSAHATGFHFDPVWSTISIILVLGGLWFGWRLYSERNDLLATAKAKFPLVHRILENRYYVDEVYQWGIDRVVLRMGRLVALFDRKIVNDIGVDGPGVSTLRLARRLRAHVSGRFADYGMFMVAGTVALALLLWLGPIS